MSEARALRSKLLPIRVRSEVAAQMSLLEGREISEQLVELWELSALRKILDGFQGVR
jgi:hypothetical protein